MIVRAAVGILLGELEPIRSVFRRTRAALVLAVLAHEEPALQGVIVRSEADPVRVAIPPRERLYRVLRRLGVEFRSQNCSVADARASGALERLHRCPWSWYAVGRVAAGANPTGGGEGIVAQLDVLTRNVLLVGAATVVEAYHAGVGRRTLRPVDPAVLELELLGWMVTGGQAGDEWRDRVRPDVDDHDARAVVEPGSSEALVGVGRKEATALLTLLEPDVDRRAISEKTAACRRGLGERTRDLVAILVQRPDRARAG